MKVTIKLKDGTKKVFENISDIIGFQEGFEKIGIVRDNKLIMGRIKKDDIKSVEIVEI